MLCRKFTNIFLDKAALLKNQRTLAEQLGKKLKKVIEARLGGKILFTTNLLGLKKLRCFFFRLYKHRSRNHSAKFLSCMLCIKPRSVDSA